MPRGSASVEKDGHGFFSQILAVWRAQTSAAAQFPFSTIASGSSLAIPLLHVRKLDERAPCALLGHAAEWPQMRINTLEML